MVCEIPLASGHVALIDDADYPKVARFKWRALVQRQGSRTRVYVITRIGKSGTGYLHRIITDAPKGTHVDHRDGNGLDNRRSNLRVCTPSQNLFNQRAKSTNTSGYKGVSRWGRDERMWEARIQREGRRRFLGLYDDPAFAAAVYDAAARHLFGPFALTNFPDRNPDAEAIIAARFAESEAA